MKDTTDPNWRKRPRWWTPERVWQLEAGIERGWSDERIAQSLGTTVNAVQLARKKRGIPSRHDSLLSSRAVANLLGISCSKTVKRFITLGWLKGRRGQQWGPHRQWYVLHEDVLAFLEDERYWHAWQPERITDPAIRQWALEMRSGVSFLTTGQVAKRFYVQHATVHSWIEKGQLPARRWANWLIDSRDLEAFELPRIGGRPRRAA